jgi:hypothetical protein
MGESKDLKQEQADEADHTANKKSAPEEALRRPARAGLRDGYRVNTYA